MVVESLRMRQRSEHSKWLARAAGVIAQETPAGVGDDHLRAAPGSRFAFHQSAVDGVFPYREAGARRAPCVDDFGIRAGLARDPLDEVENQGFRGDTRRGARFRIVV